MKMMRAKVAHDHRGHEQDEEEGEEEGELVLIAHPIVVLFLRVACRQLTHLGSIHDWSKLAKRILGVSFLYDVV